MTAKALTPQQEEFALGLAEGLSQADAYRRAYPKSARWADSTLHPKASKLAAHDKIRARVAELQQKAAEANELTLAKHIAELADLRDEAREARQFGPAINAEISRGKASGLYQERIKHDLGEIGPDWKALLRQPE